MFLLISVAIATVFVTVNTLSVVDDYRRHGEFIAHWRPLVWEASSALAMIAVAPVLMAFVRWAWPLRRPWVRTVGLHLLGLLTYSLVHVTGMGLVRWAAYAVVGEHYGPFQPLGNFLYEFRKDALVYVGLVFLYVAWRRLRTAPSVTTAEEGREALEVRDGARRYFVPLAEVTWIEAAGNYVELHRGQTPILHRAPLSELERKLQGQGFLRIHRSRLVRREAIAEVESKPSGDYVVRLTDGRELAGSRRYRRPLLEPERPA